MRSYKLSRGCYLALMVWLLVSPVSAKNPAPAKNIATTDWSNMPTKPKLLKHDESFPALDELVLVGQGSLENIEIGKKGESDKNVRVYISKTRHQQEPNSWIYNQSADTWVYVQDVESNCMMAFDQQERWSMKSAKRFTLIHDTANNCTFRSSFAKAIHFGAARCFKGRCSEQTNSLVLLSVVGVWDDGTKYLYEYSYKGELPIPLMFPKMPISPTDS